MTQATPADYERLASAALVYLENVSMWGPLDPRAVAALDRCGSLPAS